MSGPGARVNLLRERKTGEHARVAFVELFFDLVFVFAITQISHTLLHHLTPMGFVEAGLTMMAVWWVWVYTSWVTNWVDPQTTPVRLMLYTLMLAGLVLSTSIPEAFGERGLAFAAAFVFMQVGRSVFMLWALRHHNAANFRNFQRITAWLAASGVFWILGGLSEGETRLALWVIAVVIEYLSPSAGFWTPGLGRSASTDWDVEGGHMAERCGLFIIIALGESILVTGATFGELGWTPEATAAFVSAFVGSVAMWWIYFDVGAERASHRIATSADPGRIARLAYTYIHILLVAGIILVAVADELLLAHPLGHTDLKTAAIMLAGPAVYLVGNILFKKADVQVAPLSHYVGIGLLAAIAPFSTAVPPLALGAATSAILVVVAIWEATSLKSYRTNHRR